MDESHRISGAAVMAPQLDTAGIRRIEIDRLFGRYTYRIPDPSEAVSSRQLVLLYGQNGAGKTTILRMVYHILSPEEGQGHLTFLARTPFRRFLVDLGSLSIEARRDRESAAVGSYRLSVRSPSEGRVWLIQTEASENGPVVRGADDRDGVDFHGYIGGLKLNVFMLGDDRILHGSGSESAFHGATWFEGGVLFRTSDQSFPRRHRSRLDDEDPRDIALAGSVGRFEVWLRKKRYAAARQSETDTHTIYAKLARHILSGSERSQSTQELSRRLLELARQNAEMAKYGLLSPAEVDDLVRTLGAAPPEKQGILSEILSPYVSGLASRIEAQEETFRLISRFSDRLNSFFVDKSVSLDATEGLKLFAEPGHHPLEKSMLSSGEKQLLTLLCNAMATRDVSSIFIIDEPELSLNVTWQRKLIQTLLECVEGSSGQFLMASHSVELFAHYRTYVSRLDSVSR